MLHTAHFTPIAPSDLSSSDASLLDRAYEAAAVAYAPFSRFRVGAAARLATGEVVLGSNQENAAYPSGLCAERVAAFAIGAQYPDVAIDCMAVVTLDGEKVAGAFSPCGGCRQVLVESESRQTSPLRMLFQAGPGAPIHEVSSAASLLPFAFSPQNLGQS